MGFIPDNPPPKDDLVTYSMEQLRAMSYPELVQLAEFLGYDVAPNEAATKVLTKVMRSIYKITEEE